ncbi:MAG: tetratricopeptide repeat protein [Polyangiaceae bacterium]
MVGGSLPLVGGSLPAVGSSLPVVGGSLPTVGGSLPAVGGSLPAPGGSLPTVGGSLPTVGGSFPMVGGSLPVAGGSLPSVGGSLPTPGGSLPTVGAGFPTMGPGGLPSLGGNLPSHSSGGMPAVQTAGYPSNPPSPFGAEEANFSSVGGGFGPVGEAAAGGVDVGSVNLGGPAGGVGGEVELEGGPGGVPGQVALMPAPRPRGTERPDAPPKKPSNAGKYAIGVLIVLAIGGALMGFSSKLGPFGSHLISDMLNASKYDDALTKFRAEAQDTLDGDTVTSSIAVIQRARQLRDDAPRHDNTGAYAAFLGYMKSVRFGKDAGTEAAAKGFLDGLDPSKTGIDQLLVKAAQAAAAGELDQARNLAASALGAKPDDTDALCLSGEIELQAKAAPAALDMFTKAVAAHGSARTLFGLARAQRIGGKSADALATAKQVLAANPTHVGALVMIASIASEGAGDAAAIESLKKVVDDPNVRKEASDRELVQAYSALGRLHLAASHLSLAEDAFNQALKLEPQDLDSLLGSGDLYFRVGRFSEAQARFDGAMRADPANLEAKIGLDKTLLSLERAPDAQKDLTALSTANPKDARVFYWLGRADEALDDKKGAATAYKKSIENAGKAETGVPAYVAYSHLLASEGQNEEAASLLNEAAAKYPNSAELSKARGEIALATGRFDEAREMFEDALKKNDDIDTHFKLGQTLRRMKKFVEAKAEYDKVESVDKDFPNLPLERGLFYEETGETAKALAEYDAALKKAPNDIDLKLRIGSTQVIAGHAKQAQPLLKEVLKERPNSAEANHFLGRSILLAKDSIADAQRYLDKAAELDPKRAEYQLYVGWAANDAGQPDKATTALEKAIKLDSSLADAWWQLGILQSGSNCDQAIQSLLKALKLRPSRYEAYYTLGVCFRKNGDNDHAEESFNRAIAGDEKNADYRYHLVELLEKKGDRAGVIKHGETALALVADVTPPPGWLGSVERMVGEAYWPTDKKKAIEHYKVYLRVTPDSDAYYKDIKRDVEGG